VRGPVAQLKNEKRHLEAFSSGESGFGREGTSLTNPSAAVAGSRPAAPNPNVKRSLEGSIPSALLSFAAPSLVQILIQNAIAAVEIFLLSRLGVDPLAAISAVAPLASLFIAVTSVGMGGAVASAIAQALGAGRREDAAALAAQAVLLSLCFGVLTAAILIGFGPAIYGGLGARGEALGEALAYSNIVFGGSVCLWLLGSLTGVLRGMGNMKAAARVTIFRAAAALPLFFILIFGWGPVPAYGIVGAAVAMLTYQALGVVAMLVHLQSANSAIRLTLSGFRPQWQLCYRILKVACISSAQLVVTSVAAIVVTAFAGRFGVEALAGYGLAARLELLIFSLVLAFGVGTTTMVGICVGAGLSDRARRVTFVSCVMAAAIFGVIGFGVAMSGTWIAELFTHAEKVVAAAGGYFRVTGPVYGFMAVATVLFSAYQGWGRATLPLLTSLLRLAIVLAGGWAILRLPDAKLDWLYYSVAAAVIVATTTLAVMFALRPPSAAKKPVSG
jgi:MATE family, multidrug efflux pump